MWKLLCRLKSRLQAPKDRSASILALHPQYLLMLHGQRLFPQSLGGKRQPSALFPPPQPLGNTGQGREGSETLYYKNKRAPGAGPTKGR